MCAGAIVQSRMKKVVIATMNPKAGCAGSVLNLLQMAAFNHQVEIEKGVLEEECSMMLSDFFRELREKKKRKKQETVTESLRTLDNEGYYKLYLNLRAARGGSGTLNQQSAIAGVISN